MSLQVLREVVGALLLIAAVACALTAAYATDWRLGVAATAVPLAAAGVALAMGNDDGEQG